MSELIAPTSEAGVAEAVRVAYASRRGLAVVGSGSKQSWGRPVAASAELSLKNLSGIDLYEPEELVMSLQAGTPMIEVERRLVQHGQHLAFEPPDLGSVFGGPGGAGTIGGAVACNLAGPRRISAGAARDHILGFSGVNGLGERFKAGGRVVKNVTGFDLPKLLSGSFGTLAVMTQITLKVLPAPEDSRSIVVVGIDAAAAIDAMGIALRSPHEVGGAAYLPDGAVRRSKVAALTNLGAAAVLLRLEGAAPSVAARAGALTSMLKSFGGIAEFGVSDSRAAWREIRDVAPFAGGDVRALWHISVPPASGARVAHDIAGEGDEFYFDWGGGRIWFAGASEVGSTAERVRRAVATVGGHATLIRADESARVRIPVFQPPSTVEANLIARIKDNFDPHRVLNPGRMYEGL